MTIWRAAKSEWADRRALRRDIMAAERRYDHLIGPIFWAKWSIGVLAAAGSMYLCVVGIDAGRDDPHQQDCAARDVASPHPSKGLGQQAAGASTNEYPGAEIEGTQAEPTRRFGEAGPFIREGGGDLRKTGNDSDNGDNNSADRGNGVHTPSPVALSHNRMGHSGAAGNGGVRGGRA